MNVLEIVGAAVIVGFTVLIALSVLDIVGVTEIVGEIVLNPLNVLDTRAVTPTVGERVAEYASLEPTGANAMQTSLNDSATLKVKGQVWAPTESGLYSVVPLNVAMA